MSHITSSTDTSAEGKLHTDVTSDGHTSFHTTLQMVTKQGSKPLPVKVDPSADVNIIPLTKYRKLFPAHLTKTGNLKQKALHPTRHMWTAHDETPQQFLGYFIADIHHKTMPEVLPIRFYVFKDTTNPKILLSYAASERLGIVKFQIPNEAPSIALDTISMKKHITFRTPLHTYRPVKPKNTGQHPLKPAIKKQPFQDQTPQKQSFQDHSEQNNALQDHSRQESSQNQLFQDHLTTDDVCDIIAMKKAFPKSFDCVGNMPRTCTIPLDPSVSLAQHARRKVPIEYKEQIEKTLQQMEDLKIITLVTIPTEWVSSITYPRKPDGTLCICLDPRDLNKAIIREHYKAPTLEEISHKLAGATVFSKLDTKDRFWSGHLDDASSHLTTFNTHKGRYRFLRMPFSLKMAQDVFQVRMDQITERLPGIIAIYNDICVFGKTQEQHDKHLLQLLKTASAKGLVFNSRKCQISKPQITFFGTVFSAKGYEARSHKEAGITRPSDTTDTETTTVIPGIGHPQQTAHFNG